MRPVGVVASNGSGWLAGRLRGPGAALRSRLPGSESVGRAGCQANAGSCVTVVTLARKRSQFPKTTPQADQAGLPRPPRVRHRGLRGDPQPGRRGRARRRPSASTAPPASSPSRSRTGPRPGSRARSRRRARPGFEPVVRLAGGRAAAFHEGTLAFAWATPAERPVAGTRERFERLAGIVAAALRGLGVDARVGEIPGEYCPGAWSVNARGRTKLAGIGQRLIARRRPRRRGGRRRRLGAAARGARAGLRGARARLGPGDRRQRRGRGPGNDARRRRGGDRRRARARVRARRRRARPGDAGARPRARGPATRRCHDLR